LGQKNFGVSIALGRAIVFLLSFCEWSGENDSRN